MQAPASDRFKLGNRLLDALPPAFLDHLRPRLETVALTTNQTLQEPGEIAEYAFFPTAGVISMVATMADGESVEVGMIGNEGMFSVATVLGDDAPSQRAMVQLAGSALRIPAALLRHEAQANAVLQAPLLRYVQTVLSTAAQSAACNRLHLLEQRCARWLLSAHDRAHSDRFAMTHEFLAMMLGVRRPGVTVALQGLQGSGTIAYSHGTMNILARQELERASCECYLTIRQEYERLLAPNGAAPVAALTGTGRR